MSPLQCILSGTGNDSNKPTMCNKMPRIFKTGKNIIKGNQFRGFGDEREINEIFYWNGNFLSMTCPDHSKVVFRSKKKLVKERAI